MAAVLEKVERATSPDSHITLPPQFNIPKTESPEAGIFLHLYQPVRHVIGADGNFAMIVPWINDLIARESYFSNLLLSDIPVAVNLSWYGTVRSWMKRNYPAEYEVIRDRLKASPYAASRIMADPGLHIILPLQDPKDQDTLMKIGKRAYEEDLGFSPEGLWPPETAVTTETLHIAAENGYRYMPLRDHQIENPFLNPGWVKFDEKEIAVFPISSWWSRIAFNEELTGSYADKFKEDWLLRNALADHVRFLILGMDFETSGHHQKGSVGYYRHTFHPDTLAKYGFKPLVVAEKLRSPIRHYTTIKDWTSWSCADGVGLWTGDPNCQCGNPTQRDRELKQQLFLQLREEQRRINANLDLLSKDWREDFINVFLKVRHKLFNGEYIGDNVASHVRNREVARLFLSKIFLMVGMTSCGWFFPGEDRVERALPKFAARQAKLLALN